MTDQTEVVIETNEPWRCNLLRAAFLIENSRRLLKGQMRNYRGCYCLHGAIEAVGGSPWGSNESRAVHNYLKSIGVPTTSSEEASGGFERYDPDIPRGRNATSPDTSAAWNNVPERTKEEVVAALRGAALMGLGESANGEKHD